MLKDSKTLWGIPVTMLQKHSKKYRLFASLLYIADSALILVLTAYMFYHGISYNAYGFVVVIVALFFHFILYSFLNPERWMAFKFYKKFAGCELIERRYEVDADAFHSVLYCAGYKRLRSGKEFNEYKEMFLSACCEDIKYARLLMKYMEKYASDSGSLICITISKGKNIYFIDFKEDLKNGSSGDNAGDVADTVNESRADD